MKVKDIERVWIIPILLSVFLWLINVVQPLPWWFILLPIEIPASLLLVYVIYLMIKK